MKTLAEVLTEGMSRGPKLEQVTLNGKHKLEIKIDTYSNDRIDYVKIGGKEYEESADIFNALSKLAKPKNGKAYHAEHVIEFSNGHEYSIVGDSNDLFIELI